MQNTIEEVCQNIRNYFTKHDGSDVLTGSFSIVGQTLYCGGEVVPQTGYFRIVGSSLNDGVYLGGTDHFTANESFDGEVWFMHLPAAFLALCNDIKAWQTANGSAESANMSPYASESFGGYSYSKSGTNGATAVSWQAQFRSRLNAWRKI